MSGNTVSHANNISKRKWNPNLQRVRAMIEGRIKMVDVCTRCLRSNKVQKVARGLHKAATAVS
jgi:large subunit ribosomal protein L28